MNLEDARMALTRWDSLPRTRAAIITNFFGEDDGFWLTLLPEDEPLTHFKSLKDVLRVEDRYIDADPDYEDSIPTLVTTDAEGRLTMLKPQ